MDIWTLEKRSKVMSHIRSKNTKPEIVLRSILHKMGYRFRLHRKDLPGCPDIVLPKYNTIIFVHGCFWHLHENCRDGTIPKTQSEKWKAKLLRNVDRDNKHKVDLEDLGWKVLIVWECEIEKQLEHVKEKILDAINIS